MSGKLHNKNTRTGNLHKKNPGTGKSYMNNTKAGKSYKKYTGTGNSGKKTTKGAAGYSSKKKKNGRKRNGKRKKETSAVMRSIASFLVFVLVAAAGLSGYDYYQTGSFTHTIDTAEKIAGYLQELQGKAAELEQQAGELGERAKDFVQGLSGSEEAGNVSTLARIPEYTGDSYVTVNGNIPSFSEEEKNAAPYEFYSELDSLGRCGYAEAKISRALMPEEERGPIGSVKPSGWHTVKYDNIDGRYLYNRCHLIGYQLTGENANERNLITGTRYLNVTGMLPWENMVADYVQKTGDEVMYRVTPVFEGDDLLARGVEMEAESLRSDEICFHIFVFNIQPGIGIDYANGDSWLLKN